jgi:hypothetical protein
MSKETTLWTVLNKIGNFLAPDWLMNWWKKHPFLPAVVVITAYLIYWIYNRFIYIPW